MIFFFYEAPTSHRVNLRIKKINEKKREKREKKNFRCPESVSSIFSGFLAVFLVVEDFGFENSNNLALSIKYYENRPNGSWERISLG